MIISASRRTDIPSYYSEWFYNRVKEGLAGMFNLKANKKLLSLLSECDKKYPYVKQALQELSNFEE